MPTPDMQTISFMALLQPIRSSNLATSIARDALADAQSLVLTQAQWQLQQWTSLPGREEQKDRDTNRAAVRLLHEPCPQGTVGRAVLQLVKRLAVPLACGPGILVRRNGRSEERRVGKECR